MLLETFTKFYYCSKNLVYKYNSACRYLSKKDIFRPCFYGDVSNKAKKFNSDLSIPLWGRFTLLTIIDNLLIQLAIKLSTLIFQSILYYYFMFNIWFQKLMTYLFWSPMKTIKFCGCSWLIDIKSVRSISYDILVKRVMVFKPGAWV